ncbi:MAG: restriction endonuclease subunit S, partial [Desulfobacterales bacterium]|nr:restriction endonuclease subunit S [Desulfobacterales bacterium]
LTTKTDDAKKYFFANASQTVNLASINMTTLANVPVPIPPFEEQNEIVRRVEALFKTADQVEARYKKAKSQVDKLTQSILAKAFRGELVPQDPNDEPASELLKRIKAEKAKTIAESKTIKMTKKTTRRRKSSGSL